jgi:LPXTG-motif cell wall-anchored protein
MYLRAAVIAAIMVMLTLPALAQRTPSPTPSTGGRGAPLALVGAGLPMLVLVGGGYLLVRRLRRKAD